MRCKKAPGHPDVPCFGMTKGIGASFSEAAATGMDGGGGSEQHPDTTQANATAISKVPAVIADRRVTDPNGTECRRGANLHKVNSLLK
jgi:hypothetical protein